jgi:hypothetical protein
MRNAILFVFRKNRLINRIHRFLPFKIKYYFDSNFHKTKLYDSIFTNSKIETIKNQKIDFEEYSYEIKSQNVYNLKDIIIFRENGALMDRNKDIYINTFKGKEITNYNLYYNLDFFKLSRKIKVKATFIFAPKNYWHFHVEFLAKVILVNQQFNEITIFSNELIYQWQKDALSFYNIPANKIIYTKTTDRYIRFYDFLYLDFFGTDYLGFNCKSSSILLQHEIAIRIESIINKQKRIYITRKKAQTRKILNEDKLIELLNHFKFEIVTLEDLTIDKQYALFANSEIIMAQHGASLTNMLATSNSTIIEIFNPNWPMNMYSLMANATQNNFYRINISEFEGNDPQSANYIVNITDVNFILNKLCN